MILYCKGHAEEYLIVVNNVTDFKFKKVREYEKHQNILTISFINNKEITIYGEKAQGLFDYLTNIFEDGNA